MKSTRVGAFVVREEPPSRRAESLRRASVASAVKSTPVRAFVTEHGVNDPIHRGLVVKSTPVRAFVTERRFSMLAASARRVPVRRAVREPAGAPG